MNGSAAPPGHAGGRSCIAGILDQLFVRSLRTSTWNTFDAQNFDAVILCYLAAVAAGSTDGKEMADQGSRTSPGPRYAVHLGAAPRRCDGAAER